MNRNNVKVKEFSALCSHMSRLLSLFLSEFLHPDADAGGERVGRHTLQPGVYKTDFIKH